MDFSNFHFGLSALYVVLVLISVVKNGMCKTLIRSANRFKLLLLGLLISIIALLFLCNYDNHHNSTYCIFFVGFVPILIFYYCLHLVSKTYNGLKKLNQGKKFDEVLSLFFMFSYIPTFIAIGTMIVYGNIIAGIHEHESHIFIVTMFLLIDLLSSFFDDNDQANQ